ncbi:MAG: hypothetical protein IPH96_02230 [Saprospiraceae bacterium]|nr:hypothetical protein [Saprospiraceae bacterium]
MNSSGELQRLSAISKVKDITEHDNMELYIWQKEIYYLDKIKSKFQSYIYSSPKRWIGSTMSMVDK